MSSKGTGNVSCYPWSSAGLHVPQLLVLKLNNMSLVSPDMPQLSPIQHVTYLSGAAGHNMDAGLELNTYTGDEYTRSKGQTGVGTLVYFNPVEPTST